MRRHASERFIGTTAGPHPVQKWSAYIEKSLGAQTVRPPLLAGLLAACEESTSVAERAASLAPKSSNSVTCFAPADKWRLFQEGKAADLYPYLTLTVDPPQPRWSSTCSI